eukprot:scaffold24708_cov101-Isochrysis_galbana.AAC.1
MRGRRRRRRRLPLGAEPHLFPEPADAGGCPGSARGQGVQWGGGSAATRRVAGVAGARGTIGGASCSRAAATARRRRRTQQSGPGPGASVWPGGREARPGRARADCRSPVQAKAVVAEILPEMDVRHVGAEHGVDVRLHLGAWDAPVGSRGDQEGGRRREAVAAEQRSLPVQQRRDALWPLPRVVVEEADFLCARRVPAAAVDARVDQHLPVERLRPAGRALLAPRPERRHQVSSRGKADSHNRPPPQRAYQADGVLKIVERLLEAEGG